MTDILAIGESPGRSDWYDDYSWSSQPPNWYNSDSEVFEPALVESLRRLNISQENSLPVSVSAVSVLVSN